MVTTRPTKLGKIFLALMLLFYGAAVTSQSGLLLLLIGLIAGCFVVNWSFGRRNVANLVVSAPRNAAVVEGSGLTQPWTLENHSKKHIEMIEAWDNLEVLFRIPVVPVGDLISVIPNLVYNRRGVYPHSRVTILSAAPFGLLRSSRAVDLPGEVVVCPRVYNASSPAGHGLDNISGGRFRGARRVNSGAHFAGVRSWQPGDALKQVHWKTSARRGELMVKTFEEELGGRVSLLVDCAPDDTNKVDDAVRAAASLAVATLQEGHHLELITSSSGNAIRLAPFSDEGELLDLLARYEPGKPALNLDLSSIWRKSALAIVGTRFCREWLGLIEQAERQNRAVHLYLADAKQLPNVTAEIWTFSADEIFQPQAITA
jgi:uncharacterized protein (DUF58 family)